MAIKVEILRRETIKPSLPTPPHLKSYRFSRFDQHWPLCYTSVVLFYTYNEENAIEISIHLKESLSNALSKFYPFAGRLKDNLSVDCNDKGVDYLEAQVNCPISHLLKQPNLEAISHLVPMESKEMTTDPLLLIQISFFICGGMALGVNINHKIADATTLCTIIKFWADTCIGNPDAVVPDLSVADLYPAVDSSPRVLTTLPAPLVYNDRETWRIVFEESKLNALKSKVKGTENPTRVEVVLALLLKCAIKASLEWRISSQMPHKLGGAANMRATLVPPLPKNACGNILEPLSVVVSDESEIDVSYVVASLRKAKAQRCGLSVPVAKLEKNKIPFSSRCRIPFYEADFGWGKPIWACSGVLRLHGFYLMDSQDGDGIEAWVKLNEQEMAFFEKDEEVMAFGSINPSVRMS